MPKQLNTSIPKSLVKILAIILLLFFPPGLVTLVIPRLANVDFTNYPYLPGAIAIFLLLFWVVGWGSAFYLIFRLLSPRR